VNALETQIYIPFIERQRLPWFLIDTGCCKHSFEQNSMENGKWNSKNIKTAGF
jgi:hypothetical protein